MDDKTQFDIGMAIRVLTRFGETVSFRRDMMNSICISITDDKEICHESLILPLMRKLCTVKRRSLDESVRYAKELDDILR